MAIDTREKRFSMMDFGDGNIGVLHEPDGSVDLDDRQHLLGCYSGIAFAELGILDLCGPLFSALLDSDRVSMMLNADRLSPMLDSDRVSALECN